MRRPTIPEPLLLPIFVALSGLAVTAGMRGGLWDYAGVAVVLWLVVLSQAKPRFALVIPLLVIFVSESDASRVNSVFSMETKTIALVMCAVVGVRARPVTRGSVALRGLLVCAPLAYLWAGVNHPSNLWLVDFLAFGLAATALVLVQRIPPADLARVIDVALILVLSFSALLGLVGRGGAFDGNRFEGIFANPNTLGFFAAVALVRGVLGVSLRPRIMLITIGLATLVWSGSRGPLFALACGLTFAVGHAMFKRGTGRGRLFGAASLLAGAAIVGSEMLAGYDLPLFRNIDTRARGTAAALTFVHEHPWGGVGYATSTIQIASSPLRWLGETGWPGGLLIVAAYLWIGVSAWSVSWRMMFVCAFGIAHSIFEGWFFAGGSSLFVVWWLLVFSESPVRGRDADAATNADARHAGRAGPDRGALPALDPLGPGVGAGRATSSTPLPGGHGARRPPAGLAGRP